MQMPQVRRDDWLNREADRLEAAMAAMAVPVRVSGGRIEEGRVRYHATPVGGVQAQDIESLSPGVATALGAEQVAIRAGEGEVTIDVSPPPSEPTRLMPLLASLGPLPALVAVAGVDQRGVPVLLNLRQRKTWHVLVSAPVGPERSAWLRSLAAGLAAGGRPAELQLLAVDLTGAEQAFIEALPHALTDVACRADGAIDLLAWLRDEAEHRRSRKRISPHLVMVVDDMDALVRQTGRAAISLVDRLLSLGTESGVHILAGWNAPDGRGAGGRPTDDICVFASEGLSDHGRRAAGEFEIVAGGQTTLVRPAELPAVDLDELVRGTRGQLGGGSPDERLR